MEYKVLIATYNRFNLLVERSLPSVRAQTKPAYDVTIVNDGMPFSEAEIAIISQVLNPIPVTVVNTVGNRGAACAWNVGLERIYNSGKDYYIALLDDDDTWDSIHGEQCLECGKENNADIVISGLRMFDVLQNKFKSREIINSVERSDFLVQNPGWQGTNTFVKTQAFRSVGGFTKDLKSCNDRDLAIRLLNLPNIKIAFTKKFTATWYFQSHGDSLTSINNPAKKEGLVTFYKMYEHIMTPQEKDLFIERAWQFFKVDKKSFV